MPELWPSVSKLEADHRRAAVLKTFSQQITVGLAVAVVVVVLFG
jgi:hypothetical protein